MSGGRKIDQMKAAIAENRRKAGEQPAPKPVNPMPIDRRPKGEVLAETANTSGKKALKQAGCDKRDAKMERRGRLPTGSRFGSVIWNGNQWSASLAVPHGDGWITFESTSSGVFRLLQNLDAMYRKWLKERP